MERTWRKSSFSSGTGNDGNCVEVTFSADARVRDSKNPAAGQVLISADRWREFTASLR